MTDLSRDDLFVAVESLLEKRRLEEGDKCALVKEYAPSEARFVPWDQVGANGSVRTVLEPEYRNGLYEHQARAIGDVLAGRDVVVATRTSSGKSLIYSIPIAHEFTQKRDATALLLFPTKALANDQHHSLSRRIEAVLKANGEDPSPQRIARYDGDTPKELRPAVRQNARMLLTNPEMLHLSILDWHEQWERFLLGLRYIVLDEAHIYRGTFGSNMAMLLRRLLKVASRYGAKPQFIATSATIAQPCQHLRALTGRDFREIGPDLDGSRQFPKRFYILRPQGHAFAAARSLLDALVSQGRRVLVFCPSRWAAEENVQHFRDQPERRIRVYKAGLLPQQRREIEEGLRQGSVRGVFSTTALELGVDIGSLDVCICIGLPNTMMSLWQQAGRVGRAGSGAVVLIPEARPLDAYYAENPKELFERPNEPLAVNMESRTLAKWHYACALKEAGKDLSRLTPDTLDEPIATIARQHQAGALDDHIFHVEAPHHEYNIRAGADVAFHLKLANAPAGHDTVGTISRSQIAQEAAPNAIYRHDGDAYRVIGVYERDKEVRLRPEHSRNRTQSFIRRQIQILHCCACRKSQVLQLEQCDRLRLTEVLMSLTEKRPDGNVVGVFQGPQGLRPTALPTTGVVLTVFKAADVVRCTCQGCDPTEYARRAWNGLSTLVKGILPAVLGPCDLGDFDVLTQWSEADAKLYIFDRAYEGIDLCLPAFDKIDTLLTQALERVQTCDCTVPEGCFRCVRHPYEDVTTDREATAFLLRQLCHSIQAEPPRITFQEASDRLQQDASRIACSDCGQMNDMGAKFCQNCGKPVIG